MARTQVKLVLKAEAPLAVLRSRANSQFVKTLDYLPGSTVRGAFAEVFINKRGTTDPGFQRVFAEEVVWFSDFWPSHAAEAAVLLPSSMSACKRHGLRHAESLHDRLLEEMLEIPAARRRNTCPACGEPLDRCSGYLIPYAKGRSVKLGRQLRMHVGISRATGSAMSGLLFSYEVITPPKSRPTAAPEGGMELTFVGFLDAEDPEALAVLAGVVPDREHLGIGKARTRGLGEVSIAVRAEVTPMPSAGGETDLQRRWRGLQEAVRAHGRNTGAQYFTITLESHLALRDALGRPVLANLNAGHLGLGAVLPESAHAPCVAFLSPVVVAGWNAALGLPKPDTHALSRGSVLAFRVDDTANLGELQARLQALEETGVGDRRAEGFGRLSVCHPIHWDSNMVRKG